MGVGGNLGLQEIGGVKLAEELDGLALGGGFIAELLVGQRPGLADGALAVQEADEAVGGFGQAEEGVVGVVLDDMPGQPAEMLAGNLDGGAEARVKVRDAVPGLMECRAFNGQGYSSLVQLHRPQA